MTENNRVGGMAVVPHKQGSSLRVEKAEAASPRPATLESLGTYYERFYGSLMKQALGMLGSADTSREAIQEAVTDVAQQIADGVEIRNIGAYLRVALRFRCMRLRTRNHEPLPLEAAVNMPSPRPTSPADLAQLRQDCQDLCDAADELPSAQRSAFLMAELRGVDYGTIATDLGRSEHAVRQLLVRARQHVREAIARDLAAALVPLARLKSWLQQALAAPVEAVVAGALLVAIAGITPGQQESLPVEGAGGAPRPLGREAPSGTIAVDSHSGARHRFASSQEMPAALGPQVPSDGEQRSPGGSGRDGDDDSGDPRHSSAPVFTASNAQKVEPPSDRTGLDPGESPIIPLDSPCSEGSGSCSATGNLSQVGSASQVGAGGRQPDGGGSSGSDGHGGMSPGGGTTDPGDSSSGTDSGSGGTGSAAGPGSGAGSGGGPGDGGGTSGPGGHTGSRADPTTSESAVSGSTVAAVDASPLARPVSRRAR